MVLVAKKEFKITVDFLETVLIKMGFFESRSTDTSKQYRRGDGFHVILTVRRKRKKREVPYVDKTAKITTLKVHRDSSEHKAVWFDASVFFKELDNAMAQQKLASK